ncbi:hypothetical protein EFP44_09780 [Lacticaseibacillus paracasei]|nr:hypothetical protein [Lacticaseibacillus paracasei]
MLCSFSKTRLPAQKPACKDLGRNGQSPAITSKPTYTPVSKRFGSRSALQQKALSGALPILLCRTYSLVGTFVVAPFPCLHKVV